MDAAREGVLREQPDTAPPACSLPLLPPTLFPHRVAAVLETRFGAELLLETLSSDKHKNPILDLLEKDKAEVPSLKKNSDGA